MGTYCHKLKPNKTQEFPRNVCYVDTETSEKTIDKKTKVQKLKLGVGCYIREGRKDHKPREIWWDFITSRAFWKRLLEETERDRTLLILGYNMGFDMRILQGFKHLFKLGYIVKKICMLPNCFILDFQKDKHRIKVIDAMNYFDGSLKQWGKMLGLEKLEVDFKKASDKELLTYCYNDVAILKAIWEKWRKFLKDNHFGHFCVTRSSHALTIFRHRFMRVPLFIHDNTKVLDLERSGYYGGRTECFFIGKCNEPKIFKLDVNSMYPTVMASTPVPTELIAFDYKTNLLYEPELLDRFGIVAEVFLNTDLPIYPKRREGKLIFPTGKFWAVLCEPELRQAMERGHVVTTQRMAFYKKAVIFDGYVNEMYNLRNEYKKQDDEIFQKLCKYLMNSLYGKFGQRNETWDYLGYFPRLTDGVYKVADLMTGEWNTFYILYGHEWKSLGKTDSAHSFPAISAYITSAARVMLWKLIESAGRLNVFYCDTDSLIVNQEGYDNLKDELNETELGKLKLEYESDLLTINAPKDYQTYKEKHIKGVPKKADRISDTHYQYWQWERVRGAIHKSHLECVYMYLTDKHLARNYSKGSVSSSGWVVPFVLSESINSSTVDRL